MKLICDHQSLHQTRKPEFHALLTSHFTETLLQRLFSSHFLVLIVADGFGQQGAVCRL